MSKTGQSYVGHRSSVTTNNNTSYPGGNSFLEWKWENFCGQNKINMVGINILLGPQPGLTLKKHTFDFTPFLCRMKESLDLLPQVVLVVIKLL